MHCGQVSVVKSVCRDTKYYAPSHNIRRVTLQSRAILILLTVLEEESRVEHDHVDTYSNTVKDTH